MSESECKDVEEIIEECEEDGYLMTWPVECSGCLYRAREYVDKIGHYVECIHPIFSCQSYQCPVRMTAKAKNKFGRKRADDFI